MTGVYSDDGIIFLIVAAVLFGVAALLELLNEPRFNRAMISGGLLALTVAMIVERT